VIFRLGLRKRMRPLTRAERAEPEDLNTEHAEFAETL
jgi:hypothetical protein